MNSYQSYIQPIVLHPAHSFMVQGFLLPEKPLWEEHPYWQHRKHDPAQGKYHQYHLLGMSSPAGSPRKHGAGVYLVRRESPFHTEDDRKVSLCSGSSTPWYLYDHEQDRWYVEAHAIYRNVVYPEKLYARPMHLFLDGRFKKITPDQIDPLTSSHDLS